VRQAVKVPVITVGKIFTPELTERILQEGKADLVAIDRGLIADPLWARKGLEGRSPDIINAASAGTV
jgi:2,4-dienoyl-CoA reductase-like NADH-dependent reductase (Old Yellow Enzyme family)